MGVLKGGALSFCLQRVFLFLGVVGRGCCLIGRVKMGKGLSLSLYLSIDSPRRQGEGGVHMVFDKARKRDETRELAVCPEGVFFVSFSSISSFVTLNKR